MSIAVFINRVPFLLNFITCIMFHVACGNYVCSRNTARRARASTILDVTFFNFSNKTCHMNYYLLSANYRYTYLQKKNVK